MLWSAQTWANVIGTDAQNFNPTSNGLDYVTVQSSDTLEPGVGNLGVFLNYAVNTLPFLDGATQNFKNDRLLTSDWSLGLGLLKGWDIGFNVPYQLSQELQCDSCAYFKTTGITDYKINTKVNLKQGSKDNVGIAVVFYSVFDNTINNPYAGDKPGPSYGGELVFDKLVGEYKFALNLGHRWRNPGERLPTNPDPAIGSLNDAISRVPNSYIYSIGLSRNLESINTNLIFEIFGSSLSQPEIPDGNRTNRSTSSLEALIGGKKALNKNLSWHAGLGRELVHGFGTPSLRIYSGLNYNFGPMWNQKNEGSPLPITPVAPEIPAPRVEQLTFNNLNFQTDSTLLEDSSIADFFALVEYIKKDKKIVSIGVEGHTDSVGNDAYNLNLSQQRANYIVERLKKETGRTEINMTSSGLGETQPIADNRNYQGRLLNRRVVLNIERSQSP